MAVSSVPFSEMDVPELIEAWEYTRVDAEVTPISIPSSWTIRQRILDLSHDTISEIKNLFAVSHLNLSLIH
jgi:hypothetical protein